VKRSNSTSNFSEKSSPEEPKEDNFLRTVYTSIRELPVYYWNMISETGDLTLLYKDEGGLEARLVDLWEDLQQQHLDEFGISQQMISYERLLIKLAKLQIKYVLSSPRDRTLLIHIKIARNEIAQRNKIKAMKFGRLMVIVQKYLGFQINPRTYSTYDWYYTLKMIASENKKTDK